MKLYKRFSLLMQSYAPLVIFGSICLTAILAFSSKTKISNFENLAYAARNIPVPLRITINFVLIIASIVLYLVIKNGWLFKVFANNLVSRSISIVILSGICFFPALNLGTNFFNSMTTLYKLIGIGHIGAGFADLAGVLQGSVLAKFPGDYFKIDCPGTCVQYRWQYSSFFLELPWNNFLSQNTQLVAIIFWVLLMFVAILVLKKEFFKNSYFIFLCLPASLLSHERMNIEVLLFLLIPALTLLHNNKYKLIAVPLLIVLMVEIKFYPIVLVVIFMILDEFKLKAVITYAITGIASLLLVLPDLNRIGGRNLIAGFAGSYGLPNYFATIQGANNPYFQLISPMYFLIGLSLIGIGALYGSSVDLRGVKLESNHHNLFVVAAALSTIAWMINSNYMYRLLLLFWCMPYLEKIYEKNRNVVSLAIANLFLGMSLIPISLSPIRNIFIATFFSILVGITLRVFLNAYSSDGKPLIRRISE